MPFKDHYKTLEISSQASLPEIKDAYRRLARLYHPDKNAAVTATQYFQDIQEAYEVLSQPARRRTYDNELRHSGQYQWHQKDQLNSAAKILKQFTDLVRYVNTLDGRNINNDALADYLQALLSDDNLQLLQRAADPEINQEITAHTLHVCRNVVATRLFLPIAERLMSLHEGNTEIQSQLQEEIALRKAKERQNNLVPYAAIGIVLLVVLIMCLLLWW